MGMEQRLLKIKEVCDRLKLSRGGLYLLWDRGEGPPITRMGASVRVSEQDLNAWIESRKEQPGQADGE